MTKPKRIEGLTIQDLLLADFGKDEWLIEDLIPTQTLTVISGKPASFKTWVCAHLALVVPTGIPFLGHFKVFARRKVLILDKENHPRHIQSRLKALRAMGSADVRYSFDQELHLDDKSDVDVLIKYLKEENIGLVILDSLIRFHSGDENDAKQMSKVFSNLKKIINEAKVNIIFTHHHRKEAAYGPANSNSLRGSSDILAAVDCHLSITYEKEDGVLVLSHMKSRQSPEVEPFSVKIFSDKENSLVELEYTGKHNRQDRKINEVLEVIEEIFEESEQKTLSLKEVSDLIGNSYNRGTLTNALSVLVEKGSLVKTIGKANKFFYTKAENKDLEPSVDKKY